MDLPDPLQRAFERLDDALDALDDAVERRAAASAAPGDRGAARAALEADASRLAAERDAALARARALDRAAGEVSARLERAGAVLRDITAAVAAGAPA